MKLWGLMIVMILILPGAIADATNVTLELTSSTVKIKTISGEASYTIPTDGSTSSYTYNINLGDNDDEFVEYFDSKFANISFNYSQISLLVSEGMAEKNKDEQEWFKNTFMPSVDDINKERDEKESCQSNLLACQEISSNLREDMNLFNESISNAMETLENDNKILGYCFAGVIVIICIGLGLFLKEKFGKEVTARMNK